MKGLLKKEWYLQTRTGLGFLILTGVFAIAGAGGAEKRRVQSSIRSPPDNKFL